MCSLILSSVSWNQSPTNRVVRYLVAIIEYVMPVGNMSDSRFFGEAEDGSTIEGYRISYDQRFFK